jgi:hypothetical protein
MNEIIKDEQMSQNSAIDNLVAEHQAAARKAASKRAVRLAITKAKNAVYEANKAELIAAARKQAAAEAEEVVKALKAAAEAEAEDA